MKYFSLKLLMFSLITISVFSCTRKSASEEKTEEKSGEVHHEKTVEIYKVEVGPSVFKGPENAPVTIINFSDFQCPFSKRSIEHIDQLMKTYDGKIRYVFKHFPLPFHRMAKPASLAAIAAHQQGKFWEYYNILFSNMKDISDENLISWADKTGLDKEKFLNDRNSNEAANFLKLDTSTGSRFGVRGTPTIFINGRRVVGSNNEIIDNIVKEELAKGERLRAKGVKNIYEELTRNGLVKYTPPKRKPTNIPKDIYRIDFPSTAPVSGSEDADITIVVFNDYECHFSSSLNSTIERIKKEYGDIVRIVYLNLPLRFHNRAVPAAAAALAAERQGKFEEMSNLLFQEQREWRKAEDFNTWIENKAVDLDLDITKFKNDLSDKSITDIIEQDKQFANEFRVRGTPESFVNGRHLSGALPFETFKEVIDEELLRAENLKSDEIKGHKLYLELIKNGHPGLSRATSQEKPINEGEKISEIKLTGNEPVLGSEKADITIVQFSDFQCPFCKRGFHTVEKLVKDYDGKVNLVFKHMPYDFNRNSKIGALFSIAVKNIYGNTKFFETGKILFENQREWRNNPLEHFEKYSSELKIDWNKIKDEIEKPQTLNVLESDIFMAAELQLKGAPEFFINGRRISGAKKESFFKAIIDNLLKTQNI